MQRCVNTQLTNRQKDRHRTSGRRQLNYEVITHYLPSLCWPLLGLSVHTPLCENMASSAQPKLYVKQWRRQYFVTGEVRYGSIGGLKYEVPQSRLYCLCINVALCSTALQCICRVIRRSSMTMKAQTYYIIFGRPPIGRKVLRRCQRRQGRFWAKIFLGAWHINNRDRRADTLIAMLFDISIIFS